jgi:hypothetical protein
MTYFFSQIFNMIHMTCFEILLFNFPPCEQVAKAQAAEQHVTQLQGEVADLTARIKGKELEIAQYVHAENFSISRTHSCLLRLFAVFDPVLNSFFSIFRAVCMCVCVLG